MSRSGYVDDCDCDDVPIQLFRGAVERALRGKRGQAFLREMAEALDAMPVKELAAEVLVSDSKQVCAMGAVALARQIDTSKLDPEDYIAVAKTMGIAPAMAREIAFENDDDFGPGDKTPADRWKRMRKWVDAQLTQTEARHGE